MSSALFIDGLPLSATPRLVCNEALTARPVRLLCCADLPEQLRACGVGKEEWPHLGQVAAEQWTGGLIPGRWTRPNFKTCTGRRFD